MTEPLAIVGRRVTVADSGPAPPSPVLFTARIENPYSASLLRPVTVYEVALASPGALLGISVQVVPKSPVYWYPMMEASPGSRQRRATPPSS